MRVLMVTTGHSGHVLPLEPIARALVCAGHEVRVATQPSRRENVDRIGMPFVPLADVPADEMNRVIASVGHLPAIEADAPVVRDGFAGVGTPALLPPLLYLVDEWRPDLIVRESYEFASALVAERHGIPHVRVGLGLGAREEAIIGAAARRVDEVGATIGLPRDPDGNRLRREPWLSAIPAALEFGAPGEIRTPLRFRTDIASGADTDLPDWWPDASGPLVYVSFGSVSGSLPLFPGLYRAAIDALAGLPARVLLTTGSDGDPAELGELPANVHAERWVPQHQVLPHAAAVVGHGGHGSTLGALFHGVPLVAVPLFAGDQWVNARHVADVGAGIALTGDAPRSIFTPPGPDVIEALPSAIARLIENPGYRHTAERVAAAARALPSVQAALSALPLPTPQEALT
jgi:hypothetical protein